MIWCSVPLRTNSIHKCFCLNEYKLKLDRHPFINDLSSITSILLFSPPRQLYVWWQRRPYTRTRKTVSMCPVLRKAHMAPPTSWLGSASRWPSSVASCTWCSGSANRCDGLWRTARKIWMEMFGRKSIMRHTPPQQTRHTHSPSPLLHFIIQLE